MPYFIILLFLISFASINAVFYTPALPEIAATLHLSQSNAQATMMAYLIGYTLGQLVYGPIANRFGRKPALMAGIFLQIISSIVCAQSGVLASYPLLLVGRFFVALGAGVGLKMSFTYIHELYPAAKTQRVTSGLILSFAVLPGLSVALSGYLLPHIGFAGCFYLTALDGVLLSGLCFYLPETHTKNEQALNVTQLWHHYLLAAKNRDLLLGGLSLGLCSAFIYGYAALAPFIAITQNHMSTETYGLYNGLPTVGMALGALLSIIFGSFISPKALLKWGVAIVAVGTLGLGWWHGLSLIYSLFIPAAVINIGLSLIFPSSSSLAMQSFADKAHGSAWINFINMSFATVVVWFLQGISLSLTTLTILFAFLGMGLLMVEAIRQIKTQLQ